MQTGSKKLPSRVVFHGQAGVGKTSWAAHAASPLFLLSPGETGLHTLIDAGLIPEVPNIEVPDWESLLGMVSELTVSDHPYMNIVVDTFDGMEKEGNKSHCIKEYGGVWGGKGFMSYQQGYRSMAAGPWRELLAALDRLREAKRMGVILLAHTAVVKARNPMDLDYDRYQPAMAKESWELTFGWSDMTLFGEMEVVVKEAKSGHGKATTTQNRIMHTELSPQYDAKNRHNLPSVISMGNSGKEAWDLFIEAIRAGRQPVKGD